MERWCVVSLCLVFFFNDTATTEIYTLSLHDALPISLPALQAGDADHVELVEVAGEDRQELHPLQQGEGVVLRQLEHAGVEDRKSTRLNSSHANISYAVFCLKKNKFRRSVAVD